MCKACEPWHWLSQRACVRPLSAKLILLAVEKWLREQTNPAEKAPSFHLSPWQCGQGCRQRLSSLVLQTKILPVRPYLEPGAWEGRSWDGTSLRFVFCSSNILPGKWQPSKHGGPSYRPFLVAGPITVHPLGGLAGVMHGTRVVREQRVCKVKELASSP